MKQGIHGFDGSGIPDKAKYHPNNMTFGVGVFEPESVLAKAREVVEALDAITVSAERPDDRLHHHDR